jgi:hypothetical protein
MAISNPVAAKKLIRRRLETRPIRKARDALLEGLDLDRYRRVDLSDFHAHPADKRLG